MTTRDTESNKSISSHFKGDTYMFNKFKSHKDSDLLRQIHNFRKSLSAEI